MLISGYALRLTKPRCNVFSEAIHGQALLTEDISPVMPYLNAVVERARYSPQAPALTMPFEGHGVVIWPREIALDSCDGEADAREVFGGLVAFINDIWERREEIEPDHTGYSELTAMEVFRLLPGTNCRVCGEANCLAFAVKLAARQASVSACEPLFEADQASKRDALFDQLRDRGYAVPQPA
jgi:ArsR family metal-binding transcriptional regulator